MLSRPALRACRSARDGDVNWPGRRTQRESENWAASAAMNSCFVHLLRRLVCSSVEGGREIEGGRVPSTRRHLRGCALFVIGSPPPLPRAGRCCLGREEAPTRGCCFLCTGGVGREKSLRAMASCLFAGVEGRTPRAAILGPVWQRSNTSETNGGHVPSCNWTSCHSATGGGRCYCSPACTQKEERIGGGEAALREMFLTRTLSYR